jgi:FtsZ-binding cell division protein ZapB
LTDKFWDDQDQFVKDAYWLIEEIAKLRIENENLRGHVRRLERSNQQLGEENHRLKGGGVGWNKNV